MIQTVIVDDEQDGINTLVNLLQEYFFAEIKIAGSFAKFEDAYAGIIKINPDLIFLDVELDGSNAFDLLKRFGNRKFNVVFITGHIKYAFEAWNVSAIHYLLKPIDADDLKATMSKVKKELINQKIWEKERLKKLVICTINGFIFEDIDNVIWLESNKNGVSVYLNNNKSHLDYKTPLSDYSNRLIVNNFYLVHESRLVNIRHLKSYNPGDGKITMKNDTFIYVSERKRSAFRLYISSLLK